jgi:hypothetical protein
MATIPNTMKHLLKLQGNVKALWYEPCQVPPVFLVETGIAAAAEMFLSVLEPDIKEAYHQIVGQSLVKTLKEEAGGENHEKPFYADGRRFLYGLAEGIDNLAWRFFLADVVLGGLANWTSTVWKMSGCTGTKYDGAGLSPYGATGDVTGKVPLNGFDWNFSNPPYEPVRPAEVVAPPGGHASIMWISRGTFAGGHDPVPMVAEIVAENLENGVQTVLDRDQQGYDEDGEIKPAIVKARLGAPKEGQGYALFVRAAATIELPHNEMFPLGPSYMWLHGL